MAYVGNPIDTTNTFQSLVGKRFSGDGSETEFTLDVAPSSTLDIEVFVGNVRQDPNSAYTLSGTTLTFTGAPPSGTNNIYVVHQAKSVGTIDVPASGVQAGSLASSVLTGQTDIGGAIADADLFLIDDGAGGTLRKTAASRIKTYVGGFDVSSITGATELAEQPASTDELVLSDAGTLKRLDFSHLFATPAFEATVNASYNISDATAEKVSFNTEVFDTDGKYDHSTNYRFTPTVAGKYFCYLYLQQSGESNQDFEQGYAYIYKNGSSHAQVHTSSYSGNAIRDITLNVYAVIDLDADDYIEAYGFYDDNDMGSNPRVVGGATNTRFGAFRLLT